MNINPVEISSAQIGKTIELLQQAGRQECILLWLGRREDGVQRVSDVYKPLQEADKDYFEIPRQGIAALMERLRTERLYVVCQVHTHPGLAFHSLSDDKWAIVRHTGALSIVLPFFAESITVESFLQEAAVFQLNSRNRWNEVANENVPDQLRVTQ